MCVLHHVGRRSGEARETPLVWPAWRDYQAKTTRVFPVFRVTPR